MNDPAQNPYATSSKAPGGGFPIGQGASTVAAVSQIGMIISLALIGGVTMITAIMAFLILSHPSEDQSLMRFDGDAILFLGIGFLLFFGAVVATIVLRGVLHGQAVAQFNAAECDLPQPLKSDSPLPTAAQTFLGAVSTYTLVGQALMEGSAVVNAILMFIDNNFAHVIPIVLGAIGIVLQLPTVGKLIDKLQEAKRRPSISSGRR